MTSEPPAHRGFRARWTATALAPVCTSRTMAKWPRSSVIVESSRLPCRSASAPVTTATIPGRSCPRTVTAMICSLMVRRYRDSQTRENLVQHRFGESASEGVLLAYVIAAHQPNRPLGGGDQYGLGPVSEAGSGTLDRPPEPPGAGKGGVPGDRTQREHRTQARRSQREITVQPEPTGAPLSGVGLVRRRSAAHRRDDAHPGERLPVAGVGAGRQARISRSVQRSIEPVTAPVAGEHPARTVGAVGCRREADEEDLGLRVAESGTGATPVRLVGKGCPPAFGSHALAPLHESRAGATDGHHSVQLRDRTGQPGQTLNLTLRPRDRGSRLCGIPGPTGAGGHRLARG